MQNGSKLSRRKFFHLHVPVLVIFKFSCFIYTRVNLKNTIEPVKMEQQTMITGFKTAWNGARVKSRKTMIKLKTVCHV